MWSFSSKVVLIAVPSWWGMDIYKLDTSIVARMVVSVVDMFFNFSTKSYVSFIYDV